MPKLAFTEDQRDAIRHRILEAAQDLIDEKGVDGTSMRALGAKVGMTASALYAYYPSKLELLRALWSESLEELHFRLESISQRECDPIVAIRNIAVAYAGFCLENPARFRVLSTIDSDNISDEFRSLMSPPETYKLFRNRVSQAIENNHFRLDDPDIVAKTIWAGTHGIVVLTLTDREFRESSVSVILDKMIYTIIRGFLA